MTTCKIFLCGYIVDKQLHLICMRCKQYYFSSIAVIHRCKFTMYKKHKDAQVFMRIDSTVTLILSGCSLCILMVLVDRLMYTAISVFTSCPGRSQFWKQDIVLQNIYQDTYNSQNKKCMYCDVIFMAQVKHKIFYSKT